jgi:PAS domain S-box-containing protein
VDDVDDIDPGEGDRLRALLTRAEELAQLGSWEAVPAEDELIWSDNLYRIFGLEPGETTPTVEYILAQTHPEDRDRVAHAIRRLYETGELDVLDYRITRPDGDRRHVRATVTIIEQRDNRPYRALGTLQDLTDRRRAEREIAAHVGVAQALVKWEGLESGARRLLSQLADAMDFIAGVFWVPDESVLVPRVLWRDVLVELPEFEAGTRRARLRRGVGLPGRVWTAREPLHWSSTDPTTTDPREPAAVRDGLHGAIAIPAVMVDEVIAVVELKADREVELNERLAQSLRGIGYELGQFLGHRRGELAGPLLTAREIEVLQLAAQGLSVKETAERLTVSPATVKTHLENIYAKLEVSDKPSAVATAMRSGTIE